MKIGVVFTCKQEEISSNDEIVTSLSNLRREGHKPLRQPWSEDSVNELKLHKSMTSHEYNRTENMDMLRARHKTNNH